MPEQVLVLNARKFSFKPDDGDKQVTGCKITYVADDSTQKDDERGLPVIELSAPIETFDNVRNVPGLYEIDTRVVMSRGKASAKLAGLRFLGSLDLGNVIRTKPPVAGKETA